ncbi:MAG: hypothetical protein GVY36_14025 [Verrucomicrobia bacterium]|jgi:hypothetical protein|nr:hypothetical protein [Verrucomicrobiota bacterium]
MAENFSQTASFLWSVAGLLRCPRQNGMCYQMLPTLKGILLNNARGLPFKAPKKQRQLIREKDYRSLELETIDSVPVAVLSDLRSATVDPSSATLNANGELFVLMFDVAIEPVNSALHLDFRFTLTAPVVSHYML